MHFSTSSIAQYSKEHILEIGSASVFRWRRWEATTLMGLLERANFHHWTREDENRSGFWNTVFFRILDDGQLQKPCNPECYNLLSEPFRINWSTLSLFTYRICHEAGTQIRILCTSILIWDDSFTYPASFLTARAVVRLHDRLVTFMKTQHLRSFKTL